MSGQMIEPLSDGPLKVSTVASMSFSSANDEPLVQRKIHHHHHWSPSWQYKEGPTTQATQVEPQAILFKAALPNNELPSRRKGHQSTLKDFIGERRVTKGGKPSRALRMRHSTGNIGAKHHAAIPPAYLVFSYIMLCKPRLTISVSGPKWRPHLGTVSKSGQQLQQNQHQNRKHFLHWTRYDRGSVNQWDSYSLWPTPYEHHYQLKLEMALSFLRQQLTLS